MTLSKTQFAAIHLVGYKYLYHAESIYFIYFDLALLQNVETSTIRLREHESVVLVLRSTATHHKYFISETIRFL